MVGGALWAQAPIFLIYALAGGLLRKARPQGTLHRIENPDEFTKVVNILARHCSEVDVCTESHREGGGFRDFDVVLAITDEQSVGRSETVLAKHQRHKVEFAGKIARKYIVRRKSPMRIEEILACLEGMQHAAVHLHTAGEFSKPAGDQNRFETTAVESAQHFANSGLIFSSSDHLCETPLGQAVLQMDADCILHSLEIACIATIWPALMSGNLSLDGLVSERRGDRLPHRGIKRRSR